MVKKVLRKLGLMRRSEHQAALREIRKTHELDLRIARSIFDEIMDDLTKIEFIRDGPFVEVTVSTHLNALKVPDDENAVAQYLADMVYFEFLKKKGGPCA